MTSDATKLPLLRELFRRLARGRHLCVDDGELFWALDNAFDEYQQLFLALGFVLKRHARDFFYFEGDGVSEIAQRMAVFLFILIEKIGDEGRPVTDALLGAEWTISRLPHFSTERYRKYMERLDVPDEARLRAVLQSLERYGFVQITGPDSFRFRTPIYRFLDLCVALGEQAEREGSGS